MRKRRILLKEKTSENDENDAESGDDEAPEIEVEIFQDEEQHESTSGSHPVKEEIAHHYSLSLKRKAL